MKKQYISKDILMSQLNIELSNLWKAESEGHITEFGKGKLEGLEGIADFISNFCDKKVDLNKEIKHFTMSKELYEADSVIKAVAEHFFELGLKANYPITASDRGMAEEIIINLKRVEKDYRIDLTKEIEWLRNKTQKVE